MVGGPGGILHTYSPFKGVNEYRHTGASFDFRKQLQIMFLLSGSNDSCTGARSKSSWQLVRYDILKYMQVSRVAVLIPALKGLYGVYMASPGDFSDPSKLFFVE